MTNPSATTIRSGFPAGLVGGELAVAAHGDALGAAENAGLHDVDLAARQVDADAEAGKVAVPEHGVLVAALMLPRTAAVVAQPAAA